MRASPDARFFFYTRSWRVPAVLPVLAEMAALPNVGGLVLVRPRHRRAGVVGRPASGWPG